MIRRCLRCIFAISLAVAAATGIHSLAETSSAGAHEPPAGGKYLGMVAASDEPDLKTATGWWTDLRNIWTPIGWKNHAFRFNVLYNGTILALPSRHKELLHGYQGIQFTFAGVTDDMRPGKQLSGLSPNADDNRVNQGWNENTAPVLYSEWVAEGIIFKQEVFAHIPGGQDVKTGAEPLYAWVRLTLAGFVPGLPMPGRAGFAIKINAPFALTAMSPGQNMRFIPENSGYPAPLKSDRQYDAVEGYRLFEGSQRMRLGVPAGQACEIDFRPGQPRERDSTLVILMKAAPGNHVDVLIPLIPSAGSDFDAELKVGYDRALKESDGYWARQPSTAANIDIPEGYINQLIRRNLQMTQVIAEKSPATGEYSLLTGSWTYSQGFWSTPGSIVFNFLDLLGHHAAVEQYLEIFKRHQGSVVPPGPSYKLHPGFLSTPKSLTSVDWLTDHGALLWSIADHALLTGDKHFLEEWLPTILKACDFIKDARRITGHTGILGIMPPATASDWHTIPQSVWSDGWTYKGLADAVKLLKRIDHPRAAEFEKEALDYKRAYGAAFRKKVQSMPTWNDSRGRIHHLVPGAISGENAWETRSVALLDTGALCLAFSGLLDPDDEAIQSLLLWFREGPPAALYRDDSDWEQIPSLRHEMATSEPCYSWNIFASWMLKDRRRYLEGMYSMFAGAYSRKTFTTCETRNGITGTTHWMPSVLFARLAVIDDQVTDGELHLLRLAPSAWFRSERPARFENMPTWFGPVSMKAQLAENGRRLNVSFEAKFRNAPGRIVLHVPPLRGLRSIALNGRLLEWNRKAEELTLDPRMFR